MKKQLLILFVLFSVLLIADCGKEEEPIVEETPSAGLDAETEKGKEIFDIQCKPCHGEKGAGNGIAAATLNPKPRNYAAPPSEWKNGKNMEGITKTLNNGIPKSPMVAFKHLGPEGINNVAKYVLYLGK
jgi:mono/diheme cytochrome c family protein